MSSVAKKHREYVYAKTEGRCYYCGTPDLVWGSADPFVRATFDHLVPKARRGSHDRFNLVLACGYCNNLKDDMTDVEFFHLIKTGELMPSYIDYVQRAIALRLRPVRLALLTELERRPSRLAAQTPSP